MDIITKSIRRHDFISGEPSRFRIFTTTLSSGAIVTGIRGEQSLEAGYIFAPYVPIHLETEFAPRLSMASRYATREINPNLYGRITVNELYNGVQLPKVNRSFV
jgi:hypothetical protein